YATTVPDSTTNVQAQRITGGWGNTTTWNTMPTLDSTVYATHHGAANTWFSWDVTSLYQAIFDAQTGDGVALTEPPQSSNNQFWFASSETTIGGNPVPVLTLQYDDAASTPVMTHPGASENVPTDSPSFAVQGASSDQQSGDTVVTEYEVVQAGSGGSCTWNSPLEQVAVDNGDGWTIPSGVLTDGNTYCWRAGAYDGYLYSWA